MTRRTSLVGIGLVMSLGLAFFVWYWSAGRNDADRVDLPSQKNASAVAAYYADDGRPLVLLARRLEQAPGNGGLPTCQTFVRKEIDPLGAPEDLTNLAIKVPPGPSQDAAVAMIASLRDYLAACGSAPQSDAAADLQYQSVVNQRFMGVER